MTLLAELSTQLSRMIEVVKRQDDTIRAQRDQNEELASANIELQRVLRAVLEELKREQAGTPERVQ